MAVLVRKPERAILQSAVDIAESNPVFPRLIAVAVLAAKILTLVRAFQTVGPIRAVFGRYDRVQLPIFERHVADRNVAGTGRQPQRLAAP